MDTEKKPAATADIQRHPNGTYSFSLTWRGVTHPATGPFKNQIEAAAAAKAAIAQLTARAK